jgi:hypothetical protein
MLPRLRIRNQATRAPAIAMIPAKTPERPLSERNLEESSIIFLIVFNSSAEELIFSIIVKVL